MSTNPQEIFEQTFEINRRLADVAVNGGGLVAIAQKLSDALGTPVIIEDAGWERLTARMPYRIVHLFNCEMLITQLTGAFVSQYREAGLLAELEQGHPVIWTGFPKSGVKARAIAPIFVDKQIQGYISVLSLEGPPSELQILSCEQAAIVAALEISKERAVEQTRFRMERDILKELISSQVEAPELMRRRIGVLGWDLDRPAVVFAVEFSCSPKEALCIASLEPQQLDGFKQKIVRKLKTVLGQTDPQVVMTFVNDSNLAVIANPNDSETPSKESSQHLVGEIKRILKEIHPEMTIKVGVGSLSRQITDIPRSFSQARQALRVGTAMMPEADEYYYEDLGLYKLLFELAGTRELQDFCQENLEPLLEYDRKNNTDFYETLDRYLESNGSVRQTADELYIHRNTLGYRLKRIEEILSQDLSDSETRLKLLLALRIRRITQAKESADQTRG